HTDRLENLLNLVPLILQPRRQHQVLTEFSLVLVDQEARAGSRQFDDMTVRVVGVDTLEVDAIPHRRYRQTSLDESLAEGKLRIFVRDGKSVMMSLPCAHLYAPGFAWSAFEVGNQRARIALACAPVPVRAAGVIEVGSTLDQPQTQQITEKGVRAFDIRANS